MSSRLSVSSSRAPFWAAQRMHAPPGRTPIQSDWPEGNWKRALSAAALPDADGRGPEQVMDGQARPAARSTGPQRVGRARATEPQSSSASKPGPRSHGAERSPWVPLPRCSPPGGGGDPFSNETSCFFSTCLPSDGSFPSVGREPRRLSCTVAPPPCWPRPREAGAEGKAPDLEKPRFWSLSRPSCSGPWARPVPLAVPRFCSSRTPPREGRFWPHGG